MLFRIGALAEYLLFVCLFILFWFTTSFIFLLAFFLWGKKIKTQLSFSQVTENNENSVFSVTDRVQEGGGQGKKEREKKKKKDTVTQFYLDKENKIKRYGIIQIAAQCDHQTVPKFSHVTCLFFQVPVVVYCGYLI